MLDHVQLDGVYFADWMLSHICDVVWPRYIVEIRAKAKHYKNHPTSDERSVCRCATTAEPHQALIMLPCMILRFLVIGGFVIGRMVFAMLSCLLVHYETYRLVFHFSNSCYWRDGREKHIHPNG